MTDDPTEDTMPLEDYLAEGGVLTNPTNVPPRYRAELLKIMAIFVDSTLAGAAGFADTINDGPGIKERIAAAKIVMEKTDNADRVLRLMGEFGADTSRYATEHPWAARLDRDAPLGTGPGEHDMRLPVFNYPLRGWTDAVVMNLIQGSAACVQVGELSRISYQPLAEAFRAIAPVEAAHLRLAEEGIPRLDPQAATRAIAYWWPRVRAGFGEDRPERFDALKDMGLRHRPNSELVDAWEHDCARRLKALGLPAAS
ncbi:phenylacetic acid catabolic [Rhodobacterales bacterium HKCCE3408]|nr:phenylacetic acid catabolic [Rhodobacterales bacterium HKCCE3408]